MNIRTLGLAIALTAAFVPGVAVSQLETHQAGAPQASAEMVQCARVQPVIDRIITAATARLELARQSNKPEEMRAAVDHLEAALRDIRVQLAPCSAASGTAPNQPPAKAFMKSCPGASTLTVCLPGSLIIATPLLRRYGRFVFGPCRSRIAGVA